MTRQPRILIVDDERHITEFYSALLDTYNYGYVTVNSGDAAVKILEHGNVDLLVTDMLMPGMNGVELLAYVQAEHPETRRILISGLLNTKNNSTELMAEGLAHATLLKPCKLDAFIDAVKTELSKIEPQPTQAA
ncbi:MAG: DNA-binding NtrC family response regulator [Candidatus Azotimanducaceae bacterium]|jgi:DNA-binding NtrC family response regulator